MALRHASREGTGTGKTRSQRRAVTEMHDARNEQERCQKGVLTMHAAVISFSGGGNSSCKWVIMVDV